MTLNPCFEENIGFFLKCGWLPRRHDGPPSGGDFFYLKSGRHQYVWSPDPSLPAGKAGYKLWSEDNTLATRASPSFARALRTETTLCIDDIRNARRCQQDVAARFPPPHYYELHGSGNASKRQKGSPEQAPEQAPKKRVRWAEVKR